MNQLATINDTIPGVRVAPDRAFNQLMQQVQAMDAAHKLGVALAKTSMVPDAYRGKPDDIAAAILYGQELGLSAIQSVQQVFVVKGKPAIYARTMIALLITAGHQCAETEATPTSVTWVGRRGDTGQEFTSTWSIDRAKEAGYTSNAKYKTNPTEMLRAKAQTELCRIMAPDVLLGIAYSTEDLELEPAPIKVKAQRGYTPTRASVTDLLKPKATEPAVVVDDESVAEATAAVMSTTAQQRKLAILLTEAGVTDRGDKLAYLAEQFGRDFTSSKDLTRQEISGLIDYLETAGQPADEAETAAVDE